MERGGDSGKLTAQPGLVDGYRGGCRHREGGTGKGWHPTLSEKTLGCRRSKNGVSWIDAGAPVSLSPQGETAPHPPPPMSTAEREGRAAAPADGCGPAIRSGGGEGEGPRGSPG